MGCYAEAVWSLLPGLGEEPDLPRDRGWVVLTAGAPSAVDLRRAFPGAPRLVVLTGPAGRDTIGEEVPGVAFARWEPGPPPRLSGEARAAAEGCGAAVLLDGIEGASGRLLAELAQLGVGAVAWRRMDTWTITSMRSAVFRKRLAGAEKRFLSTRLGEWYRRRMARARAHSALKRRNAQEWIGQVEWAAHVERVGVKPWSRRGRRLSVTLYIGQLNSGGAERQCVNLAVALGRLGHQVRVLTTYPMADENAHYCDHLRRAGIRFGVAGGQPPVDGVAAQLRALALHPQLVGAFPDVIRNPVFDLAGELLAEPPDVLHCWLDYPNVIGAAAAAVVGTPHVILSTRNVNPQYFPAFYQPWMDRWYDRLCRLPQVHLLANSRQGAEDYARWLGIGVERFEVIYNGVDLAGMTAPDPASVDAVRRELGLRPGQPLVVGVFRMAQEKQPLLWVDVIARVRRRVPDLCAAMVGIGDLQGEVEAELASRGLGGCVRLLGQRKDVAAILAAAQVKLLTSKVEGTPNVILEAQWAGCPPVATAAGGTPDALIPDVTGILCDVQDAAGLADGVTCLLRDSTLRAEMARAGRAFVRDRFSALRMVQEHLRYYEGLLGPAPAPDGQAPLNGQRREAIGA